MGWTSPDGGLGLDMTTRVRNALGAAVAVVIALLVALFGGFLDGTLRRIGVEIAGHPAPEPTSGNTDVTTAPAPTTPAAAPETAAKSSVEERVVPIFDLVRVEPSGDAVIAGQGEPSSKVDILSGTGVVASGTATATGEWALVLSDPLKAGAHDLTIRVTTPKGEVVNSNQSVAVNVPPDGKGDVLVVLNQPARPPPCSRCPARTRRRRRCRTPA